MAVPNIFGSATAAIPLSQLDTNFATPVTIGNTAVQLGNTVTSFGNVTLTNVTISSGNVTVSAGSNTAPSITTVGDTNTGIFFPAADTIAFSEGGVESMRINSSGNLGLGRSPVAYSTFRVLDVAGATGAIQKWVHTGSTVELQAYASSTLTAVGSATNHPLIFTTNDTERARIDSSGNFQLGAVNDGVTKSFTVYQGGGAEGTVYGTFIRTSGGSQSLEIQNANDFFANAANAACRMGRNSVNTRSLNAGGTVNASGADYAEYMTKAGNFTIAKGDVIGIDANGKLTNVFADAVSFVVKSTDPSYVGGDSWGSEDALGLSMPEKPSQRQATEEIEAETDEDFEIRLDQYEADQSAFDAALEAARQLVDRIAFAGQVPVNVTGATAGQYIIPINNNGAIKGEAVSNPTFEQYQIAVGKVISIESDGRAKIIVKVA